MNRKILILLLFLVIFSTQVYSPASSSAINWVSSKQGDLRYCLKNGVCFLESLTVENLTITGELNYPMFIHVDHSMKKYVYWNISEAEESTYTFSIIDAAHIIPIGGMIQ